MNSWVPPAALFIAGSLLIPLLKGRSRQALLLIIPVLAFYNLLNMTVGTAWTVDFLDYELVFARVDRLSLVFGYIFVIMSFAGALFALRIREAAEHVAAFLYVGGSLGVVFAGDYLTLFIFWELMAVASSYLIWARRTHASRRAGFRYLLVHLTGGLFLLAGIVIHASATGSFEFGYLGLGGLASWLILIGFALNAAVPPLSAWLSDAYPEATVTGAVFLCAFTTKTSVYVLARAFPGAELLVWAGAAMMLYGIIYAILENDVRRVLAYSIISQVGYMVIGIGIGTELAINGAVAHAFVHILYKSLLFMSAGGVLLMTGRSRLTGLGGLHRTMPITLILLSVGAATISAFPLTGAFVSKSMIIAAAGEEHLSVIWHALILASAGGVLYVGLKIPYFIFFGEDSGLRPAEPPANMMLAMALMACLCVLVGVYPAVLYRILPYPVHFAPYTGSHVISQLQTLFFSALAFFVLLKYMKSANTISLDTDWFYRKGAAGFMWLVYNPFTRFGAWGTRVVFDAVPSSVIRLSRNPLAVWKIMLDTVVLGFSGGSRAVELERRIRREKEIYPGDIIKHWPIGSTVLWVVIFLLACLVVYYL